jgi:hypothetical protein
MQLEHRDSAAVLTFPRASAPPRDSAARQRKNADDSRVANLALMLVVLALVGLWLVFPPAQLSSEPAQSAPVEHSGR